jgi:hypothetical protein
MPIGLSDGPAYWGPSGGSNATVLMRSRLSYQGLSAAPYTRFGAHGTGFAARSSSDLRKCWSVVRSLLPLLVVVDPGSFDPFDTVVRLYEADRARA